MVFSSEIDLKNEDMFKSFAVDSERAEGPVIKSAQKNIRKKVQQLNINGRTQ